MTSIAFEWEGVKEQTGGDPVPPGVYLCEVEEAVVKTSQNEGEEVGYPYVNIRLRIVEGEEIDRVIFYTASTAPKGIGFTKAVFASFGVDTSRNISGSTDELGNLLEPDLLGLQCEATVVRRRRTNKRTGVTEDRNDVVKLVGFAGGEGPAQEAPVPAPAPAPAPRASGAAARPPAAARPAATRPAATQQATAQGAAARQPRRIYR
jgi:hypothetical protein